MTLDLPPTGLNYFRPLGEELIRLDRRERNANACVALVVAWVALTLVGKVVGSGEDELILAVVGACAVLFWKVRLLKIKRHLELRAWECNDVHQVGSLLKAWCLCKPAIAEIAQPLLLRLLPTMHEGDRGILKPIDHEAMHQILRSGRNGYDFDPLLVAAVLDVQTKIAIPSTVMIVEDLAAHADHQFTREKAIETLPAVRECAERARNAQTLLRAAETPLGAEALLRPVSIGEVNETQLLRPSELGS
jgi:hypothetical protein